MPYENEEIPLPPDGSAVIVDAGDGSIPPPPDGSDIIVSDKRSRTAIIPPPPDGSDVVEYRPAVGNDYDESTLIKLAASARRGFTQGYGPQGETISVGYDMEDVANKYKEQTGNDWTPVLETKFNELAPIARVAQQQVEQNYPIAISGLTAEQRRKAVEATRILASEQDIGATETFAHKAKNALLAGVAAPLRNISEAVRPKADRDFIDAMSEARSTGGKVEEYGLLNPKGIALNIVGLVPAIAHIASGTKLLGTAGTTAATISDFSIGTAAKVHDAAIDRGLSDATATASGAIAGALETVLFSKITSGLLGKASERKLFSNRIADLASKYAIGSTEVSALVGASSGGAALTEELAAWAGRRDPDFGRVVSDTAQSFFKMLPTAFVLGIPKYGLGDIGKRTEVPPAPEVSAEVRSKIIALGEGGETPNRKAWSDLGLSTKPGEFGSRLVERREGPKVWAEEYKRQILQEQVDEAKASLESAVQVNRSEPLVLETAASDGLPIPIAEPSTGRPAEPVAPVTGEPTITSIKNATVSRLRSERGELPVEKGIAIPLEQSLEQAHAKMLEQPMYAPGLAKDLLQTGRNPNTQEVATMQLHYGTLTKAFNQQGMELASVIASGDKVAIERAQVLANETLSQLREVEQSTTIQGSEAGRAFRLRGVSLEPDFSLAAVTLRQSVANGGKPLSPEQIDFNRKAVEKITEGEQALSRTPLEKGVDASIEESKPRKEKRGFKKKVAATLKAREEFDSAWEDFKSKMGDSENIVTGESGALNVDLVVSGTKLVRSGIKLSAASLSEFMSLVKIKFGDISDSYRDALSTAWDNAKKEGLIPIRDIALDDPAAIQKEARRIQKLVVESGETNRDKVVDAVHEGMKEILPEITRRQTMIAMSKYGTRILPSTDPAAVAIRDINAQLLSVLKLEGMQKLGLAPEATGLMRGRMSDAQRELVKMVNEAKKAGHYVQTDPETQLRTALETAKTAARNRIADLKKEIETREKIVKGESVLVPDAELESLRSEKAELTKIHSEIFPRKAATREQRVASAGKALDRSIAQLERDLASGDIASKGRPAPISDPSLDSKRAHLDDLRSQRDILREEANPKMSKEERATLNFKAGLQRQLANWKQKVANEDFSKRQITKRELDEEDMRVKFEIFSEKMKLKKIEDAYNKARRNIVLKGVSLVGETLNASRAILTSMDLSAVLRQGGLLAVAHPKLAVESFVPMIRAFYSERGEFEIMEKIKSSPNYKNYQKWKLSISSTDAALTAQEEQFMGTWARKIPGVAGSERAYMGFLNSMRSKVCDSMVATLGWGGKVTDAEGTAIANYVNVATGRGYMGGYSAASQAMSTVFFAPRFAISRFEYILGQPVWQGTARTRLLIASEYARSLMGLGTMIGTIAIANNFTSENEKATFEFDMRSSAFGKIRIGNTYIDLLGGLGQATVLLNRVFRGENKSNLGDIEPLRNQYTQVCGEVKYGKATVPSVTYSFLRSKLSPVVGSVADFLAGENPVGEKTTLSSPMFEGAKQFMTTGENPLSGPRSKESSVIDRNLLPLSFRDIYEIMRDKGSVPQKTAMALLALLGAGAQTYEGATPEKFATAIGGPLKLFGKNEKGERYDRRQEVSEIVAHAKKLDYSSDDLIRGLKDFNRENRKKQPSGDEIQRIRERFNRY